VKNANSKPVSMVEAIFAIDFLAKVWKMTCIGSLVLLYNELAFDGRG